MTDEEKAALRRKAEFVKAHACKTRMCSLDEVDELARGVLALLDELLTPAEASAVQSVAEVEALKRWAGVLMVAGNPLSHACYNLAQNDTLDAHTRRTLREAVTRWDDARKSLPQTEPVFTAAQVREAVGKEAQDAARNANRYADDVPRASHENGRVEGAGGVLRRLGLAP